MNQRRHDESVVIDKVVYIGLQRPDWTERGFHTYCRIVFKDRKLSITGVQGPLPSGHCRGSCGQIVDDLHGFTEFAPGWNARLFYRFREVWRDWHSNDMTAGSPDQEDWLRRHSLKYEHPESRYDVVCTALASAGLNPDPNHEHEGAPYRYGSTWLHRDVPADVIEFLDALPAADRNPAWV